VRERERKQYCKLAKIKEEEQEAISNNGKVCMRKERD
jgi:hypothetical protein